MMKRYKVEFKLWMYAEEGGYMDEQPGECYMNGESLEVIEQTAFVFLSEEILKKGIVIRGLKIEAVTEALLSEVNPDEVVSKEFKVYKAWPNA